MGGAAMIDQFEHILFDRPVIDPETQQQFGLRERMRVCRLRPYTGVCNFCTMMRCASAPDARCLDCIPGQGRNRHLE